MQQRIENIDKQERTSRQKSSRIAGGYTDDLRNATTAQDRSRILQDLLVDPETNEAVLRRVENFLKDEAAGITSSDKQVKRLSSTGRAQFFIERIQGMDRAEAARYLQEQVNRKVLTPKVQETMSNLQSFKDFFSQ